MKIKQAVRALSAALSIALFAGALPLTTAHAGSGEPVSYTLTDYTDHTLTDGVVDVIVFPTDSLLDSTLRAFGYLDDELDFKPVPIIRGFNANEDFIDLRGTFLERSSSIYSTSFFDSSEMTYGTDSLYTPINGFNGEPATNYVHYGLPFQMDNNHTMSAGINGQQGIIAGFTTTNQGLPAPVFLVGVTGTITQANFLLPGDSIPAATSYTITFDGNSNTIGTAPADSASYAAGASVTLPGQGSMDREGFVFTGWNTKWDGTGTHYAPGGVFTMGSENATLYAEWKVYRSMIYHGNRNTGGTAPVDAVRYLENEEATIAGPGNLVKPGYIFKSWNARSDGSGVDFYPGGKYTLTDYNGEFYAKWDWALHVTYDGNGNTSGTVPTDNTDYASDSSITVLSPGDMTKDGALFAGWGPYPVSPSWTLTLPGTTVPLNGYNLVYYAQWGYTISYEANAEDAAGTPPTDSTIYLGGTSVLLPGAGSLSREGYTFIGWSAQVDGPALAPGSNWTFGNHTTMYAQWAPVGSKVTYDSNGGTGTPPVDSQDYPAASVATVASGSGLTKAGHTFTGWNTIADGSGLPYQAGGQLVVQSSNVTLYAQWTKNQYTVTFQTLGAGPVESQQVEYGSSPVFPDDLTLTGHHLDGWFTDDGLTIPFSAETGITSNTTLYANWTPDEYTVAFNTGLGTAVASQQVEYGQLAELPEPPSRTGYQFAGWYASPAYNGSSYDFSAPVAGDMTLYAKWEVETFTLSFNTMGGAPLAAVAVEYGAHPLLNDAVRTGYTFGGWYMDSEHLVSYDHPEVGGIYSDTTLYAKWTIQSYTVSFHTGTDTAIASQQVEYGQQASQPESPARAGYTFQGWYTSSTYAGSSYDFTAPVAGNVTLYAKWRSNSSSGNSGESISVTPSPSPSPATAPGQTGVDVLVNGKVEHAGTATKTEVNGKSATTVAVDEDKLKEKLAAEGQNTVITIPVPEGSAISAGELNGRMVRQMEEQQAVIAVRTESATYTLPAEQIDIAAISAQLGQAVNLEDIIIRIQVAEPADGMVKLVENAAANGTFQLIGSPVDFTVTGSYGDKTVEITDFTAYVERMVALPDGLDPSRITTGVVVETDGTVRHVPTRVTVVDGVYYAVISSLTNSTYSVVWHPLEFADVVSHWAKAAVNDMGSRMVVSGFGNGEFRPDQAITRAEFTSILVKGLGLKLDSGSTPFADVQDSDWFSSAVYTAYTNGLIDGFEDGNFRPDALITREQAMTIIAKAMKITGLATKLAAVDANQTLQAFTDAALASGWAKTGIAESVQAGIVSGRTTYTLEPKAAITRAEVAVIVRKLLQQSGLI